MKRTDLLELVSSKDALELLKAGNNRYLNGEVGGHDNAEVRMGLTIKGQFPFAVILSCADSRVPPEVIFDVGSGQLFVVRTAGNIADSVAIGSIEYAVEHLKSRLIMVLGHDKCGAVAAATTDGNFGPNIGAIVAEIKPSVNKLQGAENDDDYLAKCEDENIRQTVEKLKGSAILGKYLADGSLEIVGAKYGLASGKVEIFD